MKRILAMLCVIACLCGLCVPAMAAGNITVSVKAPDDWAQVCLYVWENDTPMEGWPGTAMTKGADGLWTLEIPAGSYTNVIANNGSDAAKTADLKMDGSADCWIDAGAGVVYTDAGFSKPFGGSATSTPSTPSTGVNLSGLNSLALVGAGIPGAVENWDPGAAAGDMVEVSNGVYTKVVAVTAGTVAEFKIAGNDAWDDNYNFGCTEKGTPVTIGTTMEMINGAGSQDYALTVNKDCNLKFTVDLTGAVPTLLVEETDEEASTTPGGSTTTTPDGPTVTVYAKVPDAWSDVRVWVWNDSDQNPAGATWPGNLVMTKGEDGWYSVEIPQGYPNLLINGNNGSVQTNDIDGAVGTEPIYIDALTDPSNCTVHNEKIDIETPPEVTPEAPVRPLVPPTNLDDNTTKPNQNNNTDNKTDNKDEAVTDNTVLFTVIGSVVVLVIAAVVFIILKNKKKAA